MAPRPSPAKVQAQDRQVREGACRSVLHRWLHPLPPQVCGGAPALETQTPGAAGPGRTVPRPALARLALPMGSASPRLGVSMGSPEHRHRVTVTEVSEACGSWWSS